MREVDKRTKVSRRVFLRGAATAARPPRSRPAGVAITPRPPGRRRRRTCQPARHGDAGQGGARHLPARPPGRRTTSPPSAVGRQGRRRRRRQGDARGRRRPARQRRAGPVRPRLSRRPWEDDRVALLQGIESTAFFKKLRGDLVVSLYNQHESGRSSATRARPPTRAATSIAASTTSTGCRKLEAGSTNMAKFDLNDDSVVVHRRLRRRRRHARQRTGAEGRQGGDPGGRRAQRDRRISSTTNGKASPSSPGPTCAPPPAPGGCAQDFPNLPAWIVKSVGGSTVHWAGASLRFEEHEFKIRTTYGDMPGANLLDWPITLAEMEPYYAKAEDKMGVTRTNGIPGLPGNNNFKVLEAGRQEARLQGSPHRPHGDQQPAARRPRLLPADRLLLPGLQVRREMVDALHRDPEGRGDRQPRSAARQPWCSRSSMTPSGKVTGVVYADDERHACSGRRRASSRSPATRSKARACC